jgi:hypothetical protein
MPAKKAKRPKDRTASPAPRRQPADATAKARKPKPSAPRTRKHSYQRTRKKTRQKKRRTPKAYFDARSTTYLTYPEDINKPVNKNCG